MIFIGIDPGKSGAISILRDDQIIETSLFSREVFVNILSKYKNCELVVLEHVHAMPHQGVTSMFVFGENFGFIQGVLEAYHIPYELVSPKKWKKEFELNSDKLMSIKKCKELFPNVNLLPTKRSKKENDGIAEAVLLSEYAKRLYFQRMTI